MQLWLEPMLLTADLKYHQFYEAENQLLWQILDILKERYTKNYIVDYGKKILNFAIILSKYKSS
jgi:hypothetical protein